MDYEKTIRQMIADGQLSQEVVERYFPELAESEDERIRKSLIDMLKNDEKCYLKEIAWLEKQGESTEINPSEFDLRLNKLLKQFESMPKEELTSILSFYLNVVQNDGTYKEEKQGEQKQLAKGEDYGIDGVYAAIDILKKTFGKVDGYETDDGKLEHECAISAVEQLSKQKKTAEWSEEDEGMLKSILNEYKSMQIEKRKWLRFLKDRVLSQPKQEWSKEDEYCRQQLIEFCEHCMVQDSSAIRCADWLQFLKNRYAWKPSKEHLHTLEAVISDYTEQGLSYTKDSLNELYEQLKKL